MIEESFPAKKKKKVNKSVILIKVFDRLENISSGSSNVIFVVHIWLYFPS